MNIVQSDNSYFDLNQSIQNNYSMLDENLMQYQVSDTEDYYYTHDGLGTVRDIIDSSKTTVNTYDYYAYGSEKSATGSLTNRFKFTGRELDAETESGKSEPLYYYRARMYDSSLGSFTSRDPFPDIN